MRKTIPATFSDNVLNFSLPDSWEKLTQHQLRYVCYVMSNFDEDRAKTYMFVRFLGICVLRKRENGWECFIRLKKKIYFFLENWQVQYFIKVLDFINTPGTHPVRLEKIGRLQAVDAFLRGVIFKDYLSLENLYQGYLQTSQQDLLMKMSKLLYLDEHGNHPLKIFFSDAELLSVFIWYAAVKNRFAISFSYFFRKTGDGTGDADNMADVMNAQIRALTGGDITKEQEVLNMDCWRALTELNEKARETIEFRKKYGNK